MKDLPLRLDLKLEIGQSPIWSPVCYHPSNFSKLWAFGFQFKKTRGNHKPTSNPRIQPSQNSERALSLRFIFVLILCFRLVMIFQFGFVLRCLVGKNHFRLNQRDIYQSIGLWSLILYRSTRKQGQKGANVFKARQITLRVLDKRFLMKWYSQDKGQ